MAIKEYSLSADGYIKVSKNFYVSEFACNDNSDKILIDTDLVYYLQKIRDWADSSVIINSAYRTVSYNKKIGGSTNSYHTKGKAADIVVKGKTPDEVAAYAELLGVKGIGNYDYQNGYFNHIDSRTKISFWFNHSNTITKTFTPTLKLGSNDTKYVIYVQNKLNELKIKGADGKRLTADGIFGTNTRFAVIGFQESRNLVQDGIVGDMTWLQMIS